MAPACLNTMNPIRLITFDPGHFHAALVQKEMYADVAPTVHVYAPLTADLLAHLNRIVGFNTRKEKPTAWQLEVHAGPDYLERMVREKPGNVVIFSPAGDKLLGPLRGAVAAFTPPSLADVAEIVVHDWGDDIWARGAAAMTLRDLYGAPWNTTGPARRR